MRAQSAIQNELRYRLLEVEIGEEHDLLERSWQRSKLEPVGLWIIQRRPQSKLAENVKTSVRTLVVAQKKIRADVGYRYRPKGLAWHDPD
jgi:hypothetical protein